MMANILASTMIELEWYYYVLGIFLFVFALGLIILIHEGGHFLLAKKAGILCHEFSLGMGPVIYQKKIGETVYSLRAIPIGGYVSMAGEEVNFDALKDTKRVKLEFNELNQIVKIIVDINNPKYDGMRVYTIESYDIIGTKEEKDGELFMEVTSTDENGDKTEKFEVAKDAMMYFPKKQMAQIAPYNRNFANKTIWQRFLAVFAGPGMNFVLAFILFVLLGFTRGYANLNDTLLNTVDEKSPIYQVTEMLDENNIIEKKDKIISINGVDLSDWYHLQEVMNDFAMKGEHIINEGTPEEQKIAYDGKLTVKYLDHSENAEKVITVVPNTYIYPVQLVFENKQITDNNEHLKPVVGEFNKGNNKTLSAQAGLQKGDLITGVALGEKKSDPSTLTYTKVDTISDLVEYFKDAKFESAQFVFFEYTRYETNEETKEVTTLEKQYTKYIETYSKVFLDASEISVIKLELGISPVYQFNFVKLLYMPFVETFQNAFSIVKNLALLFTPKANIGIDDFSSFLGIYELITSSAAEGFNSVISIIAFLSVNIGFVNLLPLPALDGGRLAFILFELITKKRPSPKVENIIHTIGLFALFALMGVIILSELLRYSGIKLF